MGIDAAVEVERGSFLPLIGNRRFSKAIATFVLEPLHIYCLGIDGNTSDEIKTWFSQLASRMTEDVCLITQAVDDGNWDYSENEYGRYLNDETSAYEKAKNFSLPDWLVDQVPRNTYKRCGAVNSNQCQKKNSRRDAKILNGSGLTRGR